MKLKVLGSASSGNCYLLESENSCLIIEAGIPFSKLKIALDFNIAKVQGVLCSHIHSDHSKFLSEYAKGGIKVYLSSQNEHPARENPMSYKFKDHELIMIGDFAAMPFPVVHDVPCHGFLLKHEEMGNAVFITDTNYSPFKFSRINQWLIEANYVQDLLDENTENGSIPDYVRKRVMRSHMSLQTVKDLLNANDLSQTQNIILLHLSSGNSDAARFKDEIEALTGTLVTVADKGIEINLNNKPF
jgi:phosphoribosyl 1,2-cyclic phosphodiesterase